MNRFLTARLDEAVETFLGTGDKADRMLRQICRDHRLGKRDRAWLYERFFFFVRRRYFVEFFEGYTERSEVICRLFESELDDGMKRRLDDFRILPKEEKHRLVMSYPSFLDREIEGRFESQAPGIRRWLNRRAETIVRVNTKRTSRQKLMGAFADLGIEAEPTRFSPLGLKIRGETSSLAATEQFEKGGFDIQDESSQLACLLVSKQGDSVLDSCAGGGGKSLGIASFFPKKKIFASDIRTYLFREIGKRARGAGVKLKTLSPETLSQRRFDTVFVDAPCSGTGVLRRNPEDRWRIDEKRVERLLFAQKECLSSYAPLVEKFGELIYVTCSFLRRENEAMIENFLSRNPEFELVDAGGRLSVNLDSDDVDDLVSGPFFSISPLSAGDLFFGAIMRRK